MIGFFVNTLVLRTRVDGDEGFRDLLKQVRDTALEAYAHQDVPFEQLVEAVKPARHTSHSPLFQVMLVLQHARKGAFALPEVSLQPVTLGMATSKFDLTLNVVDGGAELPCAFEYNTDLFDDGTIGRMAGHFTNLLDAVVAHPDGLIRDLPMLGQAERQRLLVEWNDTARACPGVPTLHGLFEAQAGHTPDALAVEYDGDQLTYAELNARANRLAHYLVGQGVQPDQLVAICMETRPGHDRRPAGYPEGGRRLRAAGPGLPRRTPGHDAARCGAAPGAHARRVRRPAAAHGGNGVVVDALAGGAGPPRPAATRTRRHWA